MKKVSYDKIIGLLSDLVIDINVRIPVPVVEHVERAYRAEDAVLAKTYLKALLDNIAAAEKLNIPACQDTGLNIVFLKIGAGVIVDTGPYDNIEDVINAGLARGSEKGLLRNSVVTPLERINTGKNIPAVVHILPAEDEEFHLTLMAKGFGSENKSRAAMLNPTSERKDIESFVLDSIKAAGASACPPFFVGIGIGGSFEKAALLSKIALTRTCGESENRDWEEKMLKGINSLNIGPGGFGGRITAFDVRVELFPTHIAGLPVSVSISCWAHRMGEISI